MGGAGVMATPAIGCANAPGPAVVITKGGGGTGELVSE